jgi:hypothetical protein
VAPAAAFVDGVSSTTEQDGFPAELAEEKNSEGLGLDSVEAEEESSEEDLVEDDLVLPVSAPAAAVADVAPLKHLKRGRQRSASPPPVATKRQRTDRDAAFLEPVIASIRAAINDNPGLPGYLSLSVEQLETYDFEQLDMLYHAIERHVSHPSVSIPEREEKTPAPTAREEKKKRAHSHHDGRRSSTSSGLSSCRSLPHACLLYAVH